MKIKLPFVTERAKFIEAQTKLDTALALREQLRVEFHSLDQRDKPPVKVMDAVEDVLSGKLPRTNVDGDTERARRRREILDSIAAIDRGEQQLRLDVETARGHCLVEALREIEPELAAAGSRFEAAMHELVAAVQEEDSLRDELRLKGYSRTEADRTVAAWVNRELMLELTARARKAMTGRAVAA